jgi:lipopolysaccharide biosynthesis glycosyltransferase
MSATLGAAPAPLQVVFALYDKSGTYWLNTAVAISSLARHARAPMQVDILHDETLGPRARERLTQVARAVGLPLTFRPIVLPEGINETHKRSFSPATLFRLHIPRLYADRDLVLYLDSDLVVNGVDLCTIAAEAAPDKPLSVVLDAFMNRFESHREAMRRLGLDGSSYFNAGVLAIRPKLIDIDLMAGFVAFSQANEVLLHPDQDYLNTVFAGRTHILPDRFNTQVGLLDRRMIKPLNWYYGRVVHYGSNKPLQGVLCPATVPFFAHAMLVPEIYSGVQYEATAYAFAIDDSLDKMRFTAIR